VANLLLYRSGFTRSAFYYDMNRGLSRSREKKARRAPKLTCLGRRAGARGFLSTWAALLVLGLFLCLVRRLNSIPGRPGSWETGTRWASQMVRHPIINGPHITVWPKICIGSGHGLFGPAKRIAFSRHHCFFFLKTFLAPLLGEKKCNERPTAALRWPCLSLFCGKGLANGLDAIKFREMAMIYTRDTAYVPPINRPLLL
jgi:hypothetical protein